MLYFKNNKKYYTFEIQHKDKTKETYKITPVKEKDPDTKEERNVFGFSISSTMSNKGLLNNVKYSFQKFDGVIKSMLLTIKGLFTGKISLNALSGPVGIYKVVDEGKKAGIASVGNPLSPLDTSKSTPEFGKRAELPPCNINLLFFSFKS